MKLSTAASFLCTVSSVSVASAVTPATISHGNKADGESGGRRILDSAAGTSSSSSSNTFNFRLASINDREKQVKRRFTSQLESFKGNHHQGSSKRKLTAASRQQLETTTQQLRNLRGTEQQQKHESSSARIECDPTTVDVGVLGCGGHTQYCLESSSSSLGGYCVAATTDGSSSSPGNTRHHSFEEATAVAMSATATASRRRLEEDVIDDDEFVLDDNGKASYSLLNYLESFCDLSDDSFTCDCEPVDEMEYTSSAFCISPTYISEVSTICGDQLPNITVSFSITSDFVVTAPWTASGQFCIQLTEPRTLEYCYGYEWNGEDQPKTCTMSFNGTECTSCDIVDDYCKEFDCTNTGLPISGSSCDGIFEDYIYKEIFVKDYLPCPNACYLCGGPGGYTATPSAPFVGSSSSATCGEVQLGALAGYPVVVASCDDFSTYFQSNCSCSEVRSFFDPSIIHKRILCSFSILQPSKTFCRFTMSQNPVFPKPLSSTRPICPWPLS